MQLVNKFLMALTVAFLVTGGAEAYSQTPTQSAQPLPAVDTAKTRQRLVTKTGEPASKDASKPQDDPTDIMVMTDQAAEKQPNAVKPELAAPAKSTEANFPIPAQTTEDTKPKPSAETKTASVKDAGDTTESNRHEQPSEEAAIVPYYNNFFNTYRLGPEDIISVNVFGHDRYSRTAIIVPPSGRISLALIPGGIFVNGKTVEEVAEAITKSYDEYIIGPQVSVSLDKASSYRYSVVGDVAQPGIRLMNRRLTVTEALSEAGGVLSTGNRSKVVVLRRQANGNLQPIAVNVSAIYKGKAPDITYLVPGDQILVPGNKLKSFQKIMTFFPVLNFARIFTGGIF